MTTYPTQRAHGLDQPTKPFSFSNKYLISTAWRRRFGNEPTYEAAQPDDSIPPSALKVLTMEFLEILLFDLILLANSLLHMTPTKFSFLQDLMITVLSH